MKAQRVRLEFATEEFSSDFKGRITDYKVQRSWQPLSPTRWEGEVSKIETEIFYMVLLTLTFNRPDGDIILGLPQVSRAWVYNNERWFLVFPVLLGEEACSCDNSEKLRYIRDSSVNGVHGPYYEIWLVRCKDCGHEFEDSICTEAPVADEPYDIWKDPKFVRLAAAYMAAKIKDEREFRRPEQGGCPH